MLGGYYCLFIFPRRANVSCITFGNSPMDLILPNIHIESSCNLKNGRRVFENYQSRHNTHGNPHNLQFQKKCRNKNKNEQQQQQLNQRDQTSDSPTRILTKKQHRHRTVVILYTTLIHRDRAIRSSTRSIPCLSNGSGTPDQTAKPGTPRQSSCGKDTHR